jgi:hypothetical protein
MMEINFGSNPEDPEMAEKLRSFLQDKMARGAVISNITKTKFQELLDKVEEPMKVYFADTREISDRGPSPVLEIYCETLARLKYLQEFHQFQVDAFLKEGENSKAMAWQEDLGKIDQIGACLAMIQVN